MTIERKIDVAESRNIGCSSRGGPGRRKIFGERIFGLISVFKYSPEAVPFSFGRICAPSGARACRAMLETHLIPRARSRSFNDASNSAFSCNFSPSNSATTSRVMSSLVGPSPPVTKIISARENNSRNVSPIAAPSATVLRSSIRNPSEKISRAIKAKCVSCTSPARSSVPVLRRTALMRRERPTSNAQRPMLKSEEPLRNSAFSVGR